MTTYSPEALSRAVSAVCPDIRSRIEVGAVSNERHLWWELSCCILSSQVPYSLAMAAADAIDQQGLLHDGDQDVDRLSLCLYELLREPLDVDGKKRNYRFPKARAEQLAATRAAVSNAGGSLKSLISGDANDARTWLVAHANGVGPKQASMFLRNCGVTYDLAILDRHVLNYMSAQGIYSGAQTSISGLNQYGKHEKKLRDHARQLDCSVGLLDWAIWIVMRVANRKQEAVLV
ncbi:putative N-glycosylase/DNA lyase [Pseudomonas sp. St386]|uniref:8-oxoguanine DNA glycosylase n=1 Tax=Pseudomonas sp. St386 TaxID=2678256 RepID=UPI001BB3F4DF|nr:DNA lyase [Pseudomonas sp. St386]BBP51145.1 putative N-glycosylase/DNA lyase [Pseudomonas sp. St386]